MTKQDAMNIVFEIVVGNQGLKRTELVTLIPNDVFKEWGFDVVVNALLDEKRLVEIEYVLPELTYRVKGFLLPGNTLVRVVNQKLL